MQRHVDDAVAQGAQVLLGGARLPGAGSFFAPTVLSEVPASALVNTEETFGPLAALTRFETEEEVIRLANDAPVGLAGYFFSRDAARGCGTGDVRVFIGAVADLERGDALCQTRGKLRVDGGLHVYTVCAYACLARTAELARQDACEHMQLAHGT